MTPPIIKKIDEFTKFLIIAILSFGGVICAIGLTMGYEWSYMFLVFQRAMGDSEQYLAQAQTIAFTT